MRIKIYDLEPTNGQKSFYGKAKVVAREDGAEVLHSYNTAIIKRDANGDLTRLYDGNWSQTTGAHIKSFCGLDKKTFEKLPLRKPVSEKEVRKIKNKERGMEI